MTAPAPLTVGELVAILGIILAHAPATCRDRLAARIRTLIDHHPQEMTPDE